MIYALQLMLRQSGLALPTARAVDCTCGTNVDLSQGDAVLADEHAAANYQNEDFGTFPLCKQLSDKLSDLSLFAMYGVCDLYASPHCGAFVHLRTAAMARI